MQKLLIHQQQRNRQLRLAVDGQRVCSLKHTAAHHPMVSFAYLLR